MNQLQPNPGTWKDKEEFPFMSEQGVRGTAGYQVTYYTANQAIAYLLAEVNRLNLRIEDMERLVPFI